MCRYVCTELWCYYGFSVYIVAHACSHLTYTEKLPCVAFQIQQLEEQLEKTKEETTQMKSDLQENVELVSHFRLIYFSILFIIYGLVCELFENKIVKKWNFLFLKVNVEVFTVLLFSKL